MINTTQKGDVILTQVQYNALAIKDPQKKYYILDNLQHLPLITDTTLETLTPGTYILGANINLITQTGNINGLLGGTLIIGDNQPTYNGKRFLYIQPGVGNNIYAGTTYAWDAVNFNDVAKFSEVVLKTFDQSISGIKTFNDGVNIGAEDKNANLDIKGTLNINGNIIQNGATYETHAEKIYTKNDKIILRDGAVSGLGTDTTGLKALKYDGENDGLLVFDANGVARVGDEGDTQPLATREEEPTDGKIAIWNSETNRFETNNNPTTLEGYGITDGATKQLIAEYHIPFREGGSGTGEPNSSVRAVAVNPEAQSIVRRKDNGSIVFSAGTSSNEGVNKGQLDNALSKKQNGFHIALTKGTTGNAPIKFLSVDYNGTDANNAVYVKLSAVSGHPNGTSYTFLQDSFISVNYQGNVKVNNYKYFSSAITYDEVDRNYGDIFWVTDTENKVIDFYFIVGQWSTTYMTPYERLNSGERGIVTQFYGAGEVYASGTQVYGNNCPYVINMSQYSVPYRNASGTGGADSYKRATMGAEGGSIIIRDGNGRATFNAGVEANQGVVKSQLDSAVANMVTTDTAQTIVGQKTFLNNIIGTLQGNAHTSTNTARLKGVDTRDNNETPEWYYTEGRGATNTRSFLSEFKLSRVMGLSGSTYCLLLTVVPWSDSTGGLPSQTAYLSDGKKYSRYATSTTTWSRWEKEATTTYVDSAIQTAIYDSWGGTF